MSRPVRPPIWLIMWVLFSDHTWYKELSGNYYLDLVRLQVFQLQEMGILSAVMKSAGLCTLAKFFLFLSPGAWYKGSTNCHCRFDGLMWLVRFSPLWGRVYVCFEQFTDRLCQDS